MESAPLTRSMRREAWSLLSGTNTYAASSATTATGALMRKTAPHEKCSMSQPLAIMPSVSQRRWYFFEERRARPFGPPSCASGAGRYTPPMGAEPGGAVWCVYAQSGISLFAPSFASSSA